MEVIRLNCDDNGIDFFGGCFFASDHNSENHEFHDFFKIITLWKAGMYHVFVPMAEGYPLGIYHGTFTEGDYFAHVYMLRKFRKKYSFKALEAVIDFACESMKIKRIIVCVMGYNKPAKVMLNMSGFHQIEENKYLMETYHGRSSSDNGGSTSDANIHAG